MSENIENVIVIGGGMAGLSAAVYLGRANLKPLVFAGSPSGGQLTLTTEVENFPGYSSILGPELVLKVKEQALRFNSRIFDENVIDVDFSKKPFIVKTSKNEFLGKTVLIATGAKALWLGFSSEQRLRGKGVSACATCDGFFFRDKIVAVIGGGDTACEEALTLTKFAKKVYLIHRRDQLRASKIMQERVLNNPKIEIIWNAIVEEILGDKKVEGIRINQKSSAKINSHQKSDRSDKSDIFDLSSSPNSFDNSRIVPNSFEIKLDGVFVAIGHKPDTDIFKNQIALDEKGYIITSQRLAIEMVEIFKNQKSKIKNIDYLDLKEKWPVNIKDFPSSTSVAGVFAAGDCVDYVYRQAATAAGQGVAAALELERWLEQL